VPSSCLDRFNHQVRGRVGQRGEDAAGVEPAHAEFAEDVFPIDVAGFELGCRGVAAVRVADRAADTEAAFGEIQTISHIAADAVVPAPLDEVGGNAALHDEVLDEVAHFIIDECGDHGGLVAEAFAETARRVVFAAAFPDGEVAGGADPAFTGIEAEHHFAKRDLIEGTFRFGFDSQGHLDGDFGESCETGAVYLRGTGESSHDFLRHRIRGGLAE